MPLLLRAWPVSSFPSPPLIFVGVIHSTCSCTSQKDSLVFISPVLGATVKTPFFTSHFASPPSAPCHWRSDFPSNKTIASDGALFSLAVTTAGKGVQTSVSSANCHGSFAALALEAAIDVR